MKSPVFQHTLSCMDYNKGTFRKRESILPVWYTQLLHTEASIHIMSKLQLSTESHKNNHKNMRYKNVY